MFIKWKAFIICFKTAHSSILTPKMAKNFDMRYGGQDPLPHPPPSNSKNVALKKIPGEFPGLELFQYQKHCN